MGVHVEWGAKCGRGFIQYTCTYNVRMHMFMCVMCMHMSKSMWMCILYVHRHVHVAYV